MFNNQLTGFILLDSTNKLHIKFNDHALLQLCSDHGISGQFHSEFNMDLYLEYPPSGKFDTNDLVMALAVLT